MSAADESLGANATVAVLRAYDRGYELLQIFQAIYDGGLAADGSIVDADGVAVAPFREPSGVIEGDGSSVAVAGALAIGFGGGPATGEDIAIEALETGIAKTTKRIDKKVDLEERAERAGASDEDIFTMLAVMVLMDQGYSPEQIIVDGIVAGGIRFLGIEKGLAIVDEEGKRIRPDGVEVSEDTEEAAGQLDSFSGEIVDAIGGIDPRTGAGTDFASNFVIELEISAIASDSSITIVGSGQLGQPKDRSLRGFVVGNGDGEVVGHATCSDRPVNYSGSAEFGFSGPVTDERATIRIAIVDTTLAGDDTSGCFGDLDDVEQVLESQTYGPLKVRLRDGATATADSSFGDSAVTTTVTIR